MGGGQKTNPRMVYLGKITRRALWVYLARRDAGPQDKLFDLDMETIRSMLRNLGKRANGPNTRPHRFRHSFAITWLRNGRDVFTLKRLLGHHSLKMVEIYLDLAQADVENAHKKAGPVDNLKL